MTLKRYPGLPRAEGTGGTPGKCDGCGNLAPRGKRICRACKRRLAPDHERKARRVFGRDIPWVVTMLGRKR
jgi:predicted amidophosphoribosyltransferase